MEKIGKNQKIGQVWRSVALLPYVVQKSWQDRGNFLAFGLQRGINSISLQDIRWPVACSWVRCLFDWLLISDFGGKWPLKWKILKLFFQIYWRDTELRLIAKFGEIGRCKVPKRSFVLPHKKTRASRNLSQTPFCPKWADRPKNSLNVVAPWPVNVYQIWSGSAAFCRTYSGKIAFWPIIGFQRTKIVSNYRPISVLPDFSKIIERLLEILNKQHSLLKPILI